MFAPVLPLDEFRALTHGHQWRSLGPVQMRPALIPFILWLQRTVGLVLAMLTLLFICLLIYFRESHLVVLRT